MIQGEGSQFPLHYVLVLGFLPHAKLLREGAVFGSSYVPQSPAQNLVLTGALQSVLFILCWGQ